MQSVQLRAIHVTLTSRTFWLKLFRTKMKPRNQYLILLLGTLAIVVIWATQPKIDSVDLPQKIDFNYHIRPILSNKCFTCHGPDSSSRKADLRLDIPGFNKEELVRRITTTDPSFVMPPPAAKKELSVKEIGLLKKWIKQGAGYKKHWALEPPRAPVFSKDLEYSTNSEQIDFLINDKIQEHDLTPALNASKSQLIRRVSVLLTGLPPSPEDVESFTADTSSLAYSKVVDKYLSSPQFGERWARHWMDLVRYAEGMGHEFDFQITGAHHYRDYLIRAFNKDVPFDQFVIEHLAGDQMESPRRHPAQGYNESEIGTAFYYLGEGKHSPVSLKEEEYVRIDNMIDVVSKTFMGLTVSCARCHDHKFDPIPTTDYYAMYGMMESIRIGPKAISASKMASRDIALIKSKRASFEKEIQRSIDDIEVTPQLLHRLNQQKKYIKSLEFKEASHEAKMKPYSPIMIGDFRSGDWNDWYTDGLAFGDAPVEGRLNEINLAEGEIKFEGPYTTSRSIATGVGGVLHSPNFTIDKDFIVVKTRGRKSTIRVIVDNFQLIQNPLWGSFAKEVNHQEWENITLDVSMAKGHKAYLAIFPGRYRRHDYSLDSNSYIDVEYVMASDTIINEYELQEPIPEAVWTKTDVHNAVSNWDKSSFSTEQAKILTQLFHLEAPDISSIKEIATDLTIASDQYHDSLFVIGAMEGEAVFSPVFIRGDRTQNSEERVPHGFLAAIDSIDGHFPQTGSGRMAWAESVIHKDNPLASRVMANRIWHHLFGRGIVESVDNFGIQGSLPSHPELLDYLAIQFKENGWSVKGLIRDIVLSETFQRTTSSIDKNKTIDPSNIYLHHFPVRRMEAEAIRDGILLVSGELDLTMFGPSIPIHLTEFMTGRGRPAVSGRLDGWGRRSIYTEVRRNFLFPFMQTFDTPMPFSTFGKRNSTNVPAQSLALLNDPFVHDQAQKWADDLLKNGALSFEDRIQEIYMTAFSRKATLDEIEGAKEFHTTLRKTVAKTSGTEIEDRLLWKEYCHTIYNLKEFIYLL